MKSSKAGSSPIVNLNDSDDSAFVFKNLGQKRKLKTVSPKVKRQKVASQLSKSAASSSQHVGKQPRKPPTNRSVPIILTKRTKKSSGTAGGNDSSKTAPSSSPSSSDISKTASSTATSSGENNSKGTHSRTASDSPQSPKKLGQHLEGSALDPQRLVLPPSIDVTQSKTVNDQKETETDLIKESDAASDNSKSPKKLETSAQPFEAKVLRQNQQVLSKFFDSKKSNKESKNDSFVCPLCSKTFDNRITHTSHVKQCAKKKKIPLAKLLETMEAKEKGKETCSTSRIQDSKVSYIFNNFSLKKLIKIIWNWF